MDIKEKRRKKKKEKNLEENLENFRNPALENKELQNLQMVRSRNQ